jgi:hypothetical protein
MPEIGTAPVLSVVVGLFHSCLYVLLRGTGGGRLAAVLVVAILGAWAGNAVGSRLGDPLRVGDYGLIYSSLVAWAGIGIVALVSLLAPAASPARDEA